jgi:sugar phosphate isomerase/epimerase
MAAEVIMIFGFNTIGRNAVEGLDYAIANGMGHLEIDLANESALVTTLDPVRIETLRQKAAQGNVRLSLHAPFDINLAESAPFIRRGCLHYFKQCIHLAHRLRATHLTVHGGFCLGISDLHQVRTRALDALAANLAELLKLCEKLDVMLALENLNRIGKGEFFYLGDNTADLELIFNRVPSPKLALCLDIGHAHTCEGVQAYLDRFGPRIISIHYHDNDGTEDMHLDIGRGSVDWPAVAASLTAISYAGPFISETLCDAPMASMEKFMACGVHLK